MLASGRAFQRRRDGPACLCGRMELNSSTRPPALVGGDTDPKPRCPAPPAWLRPVRSYEQRTESSFCLIAVGSAREGQDAVALNLGVCPNIAGAASSDGCRGWDGGTMHPGHPPKWFLRNLSYVPPSGYGFRVLLHAGAYPDRHSGTSALLQLQKQWHRSHGRGRRCKVYCEHAQ